MLRYLHGDDAGYVAWLAANPNGYVLNTWVPPHYGDAVLHRAKCILINRQLGGARSWTLRYAKVCADTSGQLEVWAQQRNGVVVRECVRCMRDSTSVRSFMPRSSRAPVALSKSFRFVGSPVRVAIQRMDGGPGLEFVGAQWLAELFFRLDPSSLGSMSYDAATLTTSPDVFSDADVSALNRTMAARTAHSAWLDLTQNGRADLLELLDPAWDMLETDDVQWKGSNVPEVVSHVVKEMTAPHRARSIITKMLHLKRPKLVPVLDSLVLDQIGGRSNSTAEVMAHLRQEVMVNREALHAIEAHLSAVPGADGGPINRSAVRALDALLWTSHPSSVLHPAVGQYARSSMTLTVGPKLDG